MSVKTRWDVVIVGAGPAGSAAAYTLAKAGFDVLVLERGRQPGYKELFGGRIYAGPLKEIFGDELEKAPIHRWVKRERISLVGDGRMVSIDYRSPESTSFTAYLTQFARWMASKAEEAGAKIVEEITVDRLVYEDGRVKGVESGPDRVYADVVIDAEGVNRLLLERLGLVEKLKPEQVALGVKEIIKLGEDKVNERFGLSKGEGMAWLLMGEVTGYIPGGAFIYTNKDTVSVGIVVHLGHAMEMLDEHIHLLAEKLRLHPLLHKYWADGDVMEYGGHLTPEAGLSMMPKKLALPGLLITGDAAGLLLNVGYTVRGVDYAAYSGYLAAKSVIEAQRLGGYTEENLSLYEQMLRESFIYKDLSTKNGMGLLFREPEMFKTLPKLAVGVTKKMFELGMETPSVMEAFMEAAGEAGIGSLGEMLKLLPLLKML